VVAVVIMEILKELALVLADYYKELLLCVLELLILSLWVEVAQAEQVSVEQLQPTLALLELTAAFLVLVLLLY
jgi:hypothetical protein